MEDNFEYYYTKHDMVGDIVFKRKRGSKYMRIYYIEYPLHDLVKETDYTFEVWKLTLTQIKKKDILAYIL